MSRARLITCVLLPFAAGYFLSYLFRTVNAVIAGDLVAELNLSAADLGLLTSTYFLVFASVQLPLGTLLDRFGPNLVQSVLMLLASAGALIFACADSFAGLVIGRGLIGLGVAAALMAGIKAIMMWFPPDRLALATGWLVTLGALGALTATGPTELMVQHIGWRGLFIVLAGLSAIAALLVLFAAPEQPPPQCRSAQPAVLRRSTVTRGFGASPRSPPSASAPPWLRDVDGFERTAVVHHLGIMAIAVCAGALLLGTAADRLRRAGVKTESLLLTTLGLSMLAQAVLILRWPLPPLLPWTIIAAAGAATVLSYALMSEYFPKAISGRANGALNLLHVGCAFLLQSATGFIIEQWSEGDARRLSRRGPPGRYGDPPRTTGGGGDLVRHSVPPADSRNAEHRNQIHRRRGLADAIGVVPLRCGLPHMAGSSSDRTQTRRGLAARCRRVDLRLRRTNSSVSLGKQRRRPPGSHGRGGTP